MAMPGGPDRIVPEFDFTSFEGFAAPGSTQVPDIFFDKIMAHLQEVELRVLLYFFRRTFGFKKASDNVSIGQMVNGIRTREGKILDYGCGLSKSGVTKGLRGLLDKNLVVATRRSDAQRGNLPTNYALNMKGVQTNDEPALELSEIDEDGGYSQRTPPLSTAGDKGVSSDVDKGSPRPETTLGHRVDTQVTVTNKQNYKVVNDVTAHDQKPSPSKNRSSANPPTISDRALRSKYELTDDQIGQVHWLVEKQTDILGAADRNHAAYVKRAAEAVRAGETQVLDHKLSDFKQAATSIAVASRPAYFHAMWTEALQQRAAVPPIPTSTPAKAASGNPERISGLFGSIGSAPEASIQASARDERIDKLIADAERRGYPVPSHIRSSKNFAQVSQWWAALAELPRRS